MACASRRTAASRSSCPNRQHNGSHEIAPGFGRGFFSARMLRLREHGSTTGAVRLCLIQVEVDFVERWDVVARRRSPSQAPWSSCSGLRGARGLAPQAETAPPVTPARAGCQGGEPLTVPLLPDTRLRRYDGHGRRQVPDEWRGAKAGGQEKAETSMISSWPRRRPSALAVGLLLLDLLVGSGGLGLLRLDLGAGLLDRLGLFRRRARNSRDRLGHGVGGPGAQFGRLHR
jgi:hypothetical protein